jgi:hypothetical protein
MIHEVIESVEDAIAEKEKVDSQLAVLREKAKQANAVAVEYKLTNRKKFEENSVAAKFYERQVGSLIEMSQTLGRCIEAKPKRKKVQNVNYPLEIMTILVYPQVYLDERSPLGALPVELIESVRKMLFVKICVRSFMGNLRCLFLDPERTFASQYPLLSESCLRANVRRDGHLAHLVVTETVAALGLKDDDVLDEFVRFPARQKRNSLVDLGNMNLTELISLADSF